MTQQQYACRQTRSNCCEKLGAIKYSAIKHVIIAVGTASQIPSSVLSESGSKGMISARVLGHPLRDDVAKIQYLSVFSKEINRMFINNFF